MATLGEAVVEVGADTSHFRSDVEKGVNAGLNSASRSMKNLGKGMTNVGQKMTLGITAPLVGAGVAAVKTAGEFEQSMNVLQAATGMGKAGMDALGKQAIQLGSDTVFSANEAADAMVELGKAGQTQSQIMATVPEVLNLAATEGLALADAAGIVTSAMAPFSLKAEEAGQVVNALAGASNASKASVATLSQALKLVGGAASGTGLTIQETTGALAALAQNGLEGGIAGTSLAGVLRRLQPATKKASAAMEALGLDFVKGNGEFESIDTIAGQLQETFKGMPAAARQAKLSAIFGNDASVMQAVNALINTGAKGMRDFTKASMDQTAAQRLAEARMKGVKGAIEKMKGSLETAALVFGQALIPMVSKAADVIADLADRFANLSPTAQKVVLVVAGIAAAIGPVLVVVGSLITAVGTIAGVFAGLGAAAVAPIAVFAAIAIGVGLLLAKSAEARAVVVGAFNEIRNAVVSAAGPIIAMIQGQLIPAFMVLWPVIEKVGVIVLKVFAGAVVGAVKGAIQVISGLVSVITGVVQVISGVLSGDWSRAWQGVKNIVSGVLNAVAGIIKVWLNVGVLSVFRRGFTMLTGLAKGGWNALKGLFTKGVSTLGNVLGKITQVILAPFRIAFNAARAVVSAAWSVIKTIFSVQLAVIKGIVTGNFGALRGIISGAMATIKGIFSSGWNALKGIVTNAWNAIKGAVTTGVTNAVNAVKSLPGKAAAVITGGISAMKSAGSALIGGLVAGISDRIGDAVQAVQNGLSKIKGLLPGSPIKWGPLTSWNNGGAGKRLMDLLARGLTAGIPGVVDAVTNATALIARQFEDSEVGPAVQGMTASFEDAAAAATAAVEAQLKDGQALRDRAYDQQKRQADKAYDQEKKRLEQKYDGKKEEKKLARKLANLKDQTDKNNRAMEKSYNQDTKALEKKSKADNALLTAAVNAQRGAIMAMAAQWDGLKVQYDAVGEALDTATSDLKSKMDELNSYAKKVGDNLIESVFGPSSDPRIPVKFTDMVANLQKQLADAEAMAKVLAGLRDLGLNATSYAQIADAGTESLAAAQALLAEGAAGVATINSLQGAINTQAENAGAVAAQYLYGAGVNVAQGIVDELAAQQGALGAQMAVLGQTLAQSFSAALAGISLPAPPAPGGGGGDGGGGKHKYEPKKGANGGPCRVCGRPRSASVHTNSGNNNARGTLSSADGWARVGEGGPELVRLPGGSRVYPAQQSERMSQGDQRPINLEVKLPTGDPEAAAMAVMNRLAGRV